MLWKACQNAEKIWFHIFSTISLSFNVISDLTDSIANHDGLRLTEQMKAIFGNMIRMRARATDLWWFITIARMNIILDKMCWNAVVFFMVVSFSHLLSDDYHPSDTRCMSDRFKSDSVIEIFSRKGIPKLILFKIPKFLWIYSNDWWI